MDRKNPLSIVIQAGGQSSRMGQDKALVSFMGEPMIQRVVRRLDGLADEVIVTTNHPENFTFLNLPLIADILPGIGALGGLYTALTAANNRYVAVLACDLPFISRSLVAYQLEILLREGVDAVIPRTPDGLEPLHAVYCCGACQPAVKKAIDLGQRRMISWLGDVQTREMSVEEVAKIDPGFRSFLNVNTPEELRLAEQIEME